MQLGFVSAILPDLSLEEVFAFARESGFACVELMCWPPGGADRRYAGVIARLEALGKILDSYLEDPSRPIAEFEYQPQRIYPDGAEATLCLSYARSASANA